MKRWIVVCLVLFLVTALALVSCEKKKKGSLETEPAATTAPEEQTTAPEEQTTDPGTTVYEGETVTVTFAGEGIDIAPAVIPIDTCCPEPERPAAPAGHHFVGWFLPNGQPFDFEEEIGDDLTLTARFEINLYTVTFYVGEEPIAELEDVAYGTIVTPPSTAGVTVPEGKEIDGWIDVETEQPFDFSQGIDADYDLLLTFRVRRYTVTFVDPDNIAIGDPVTVEHGSPVARPADPAGNEYLTFVEWRVGAAAYDFSSPVTRDLRIMAYYNVDPSATFTVVYKTPDGTVLSTQTVGYGENTVIPTAPTGCYYQMDNVGQAYNVHSDREIILREVDRSAYEEGAFSPAKDTVSRTAPVTTDGNNVIFFAEGNDIVFQKNMAGAFQLYLAMVNADTYTSCGIALTLAIEVDGAKVASYTYTTTPKWVTVCNVPGGDRTIRVYVESVTGTDAGKDIQHGLICTSMKANLGHGDETHVVTFKMADGTVVEEKTVGYGMKVTAPTMAATLPDGSEFLGWYNVQGIAFDPTKPVKADTVYIAKYFKGERYTVTFELADGTRIDQQTVLEGENARLPALSGGVYTYTPADALYRISESKTVVLTPVRSTEYSAATVSTTSAGGDYSVESSNFKSWGTVLWEKDQYFQFTANCVGSFEFYAAVDKVGRTVVVHIEVDGMTIETLVIDTTEKTFSGRLKCSYTVAAGQHTIRIVVDSATTTGPDAYGDYSGLSLTAVYINVPK
ncbi:MAG: InlB B-repeat-containing protein [Clostridia bacterium]|nr:InlB B-repeat-containing protein [Clostridia bacterium]